MDINLSQLKQDITELMLNHPDNYVRILHSKCYQDKYGKYVDYINESTKDYLSDPKYKFTTKLYWVLNDIKEFPKCGMCGNLILRNVDTGIKGYSRANEKIYCSNSCAQSNEEHQAKMKAIAQERYGCDSIIGSKKVREKINRKFEENVKKNPDFFKERALKSKETCLNKYGVEHPQQVKEIRERTVATAKKNSFVKYGVEFPLQREEIKQKMIMTNREKYGTDFPLQNREYQRKCCELAISKEAKQKRLETALKCYGVNNLFHIGMKKAITTIHKNSYNHLFSTTTIPMFSFDEYIEFLEIDDGTGELNWKCIECGNNFLMRPFQHYYHGSWVRCLKCHPFIRFGFSQGEKQVLDFVKELLPNYIIKENDNTVIRSLITGRPLELDIWIPELKRAIEYQGEYWHTKEVAIRNDEAKRDICYQMNIGLLQLDEKMWVEETDKAKLIIKEFLKI